MKRRVLRGRQKGQSLVEMAFALPILLFVVVGIIEVGYALNAYVQTINAAREGARFGSMGGSDNAITSIVQGATSGLIPYEPTNTDLYIARVEIGQDPCVVTTSTMTKTMDAPDLEISPVTAQDIVDRLAAQGGDYCGLSFVVVDLQYRSPSFLRLPLVKQLSEAVPMRSLSVMRLETPRPLKGVCNVYPIAVHRSVLAGKERGDDLGDIYNGVTEGTFGWLRWPNDPSGGSAVALIDALTRPTSAEFQNAVDPDDTHLSIGDWVWANTGVGNAIGARDALDNLIARGWIRIVVWDEYDAVGANGMYRADNFAIVRLTNYSLPHEWIQATFIRYDATGCVE